MAFSIHLASVQSNSFNPGGFEIDRVTEGAMHQELRDHLVCGICLEILTAPMECDNCRGLFCQKCISRWGKNCPYHCPG